MCVYMPFYSFHNLYIYVSIMPFCMNKNTVVLERIIIIVMLTKSTFEKNQYSNHMTHLCMYYVFGNEENIFPAWIQF